MDEREVPSHEAIEAVWRIESARLLGGLVRLVRDVDLAEDLAQEALLAALERWPASGIPDNPGGWLMLTVARGSDMRDKQLKTASHREVGRCRGASLETLEAPLLERAWRVTQIAQ